MKKMLAIALVAGSVSGCASMMSGSSQSVSVAPMNSGTIDASATCTLTNKKGSWVTTGGGSVTVRKSSDDLNVTCKDNETAAMGMQSAPKSTQVGYAVANFIIWDFCTISCLIDFGSGSIYKYPSQIQVPMQAPAPAEPVMVEMPGDIVLEGQVGPMSVVAPESDE